MYVCVFVGFIIAVLIGILLGVSFGVILLASVYVCRKRRLQNGYLYYTLLALNNLKSTIFALHD